MKATISYLTTDAVATLADTNKGENGWYTGTVIIQAPEGFTISSTLDGTYAENFTTDVSGENTYYLRQNDSGYTTDAKTISVKIDTDKPVVGRISMSTHYQVGWYLSNKDIQITQRVEDNTSGPDHVTYTLTPAADAEGTIGTNPASGIAEVDANGSAIITVSKEFKGKIEITPYDKAGNAGDTVTFEKMATEDEAPDLKLTDSFTDDWYTTEQTVHVSARDTFSGLYKITYTVDGGKEQTLFEAKTDYDDPMVTDEKKFLSRHRRELIPMPSLPWIMHGTVQRKRLQSIRIRRHQQADTDYWGSSNGYYCYITGDGRGRGKRGEGVYP